jgi:hypothetical protein
MQPLSRKVRLIYLTVFAALFTALIPIVIMYAEGWRFSPTLGIYKTGGIYVAVPYTNVAVTLEGRDIGTTGLLQRNFYIDDLPPATYVVRASRAGDYPWERMVVVEPQLVTDARVFLVPMEPERTMLVLSNTATSSGKAISGDEFEEYLAAFATSTHVAGTSTPLDLRAGIGLFIRAGELFARWVEADRPLPSNFCLRPSRCVSEVALTRGDGTVTHAVFYEDGVLYRSDSGVFYTELDVRPTPRVITLSQAPGSDFRIFDGVLILREEKSYYEIDL